jgi:hypothetical protein
LHTTDALRQSIFLMLGWAIQCLCKHVRNVDAEEICVFTSGARQPMIPARLSGVKCFRLYEGDQRDVSGFAGSAGSGRVEHC